MKTRFDKLQFLIDNSNEHFAKECVLLTELVTYMTENDFSDFFEKVCREWDVRDFEGYED